MPTKSPMLMRAESDAAKARLKFSVLFHVLFILVSLVLAILVNLLAVEISYTYGYEYLKRTDIRLLIWLPFALFVGIGYSKLNTSYQNAIKKNYQLGRQEQLEEESSSK